MNIVEIHGMYARAQAGAIFVTVNIMVAAAGRVGLVLVSSIVIKDYA